MRRQLLAGALALSLLAACGGGGDDDKVATRKRSTTTGERRTTTTSLAVDGTTTSTGAAAATTTTRRAGGVTTSPPAAPNTTGAPGADQVKATQVATLTRPISLAVRPGEPGAVYIAQKGGNVRRLRITATGATVDNYEVIELANRISTGSEQGLLGIAFAPDGNWLYAYYTDTGGTIQVSVFPFSNGRASLVAERQILSIPHPQHNNHNGGHIAFGPDGHLYIATGDGGGAGDPFGNAQNLGSLLGKILRIAPRTSGQPTYTIPADNPFVSTQGARAEIFHFGLRNPWRWSFDRATGEQWIADVGQNAYEEVNHIGAGVKGVNFGWNRREGRHPYNGGARPPGAVDPVIETTHAAGNCSITGGYVYRGATIRGFAGTYLFTDYCRGQLVAAAGGTTRDLGIAIPEPSSFGEDASGELWVLSLKGGVYRLGRL